MVLGSVLADADGRTLVGRAVAVVSYWLPLAIMAVAWEIAALELLPAGILPPVSVVGAKITDFIVSGDIWPHLAVSLYRVALGLAAGIGIGVTLGIGMARVQSVEDFFNVFLTMTYPVPKTALVPLVILWFGVGTKTAVTVIFLGTLIPIVINSYNGAISVDEKLLWSAQMMGTSRRTQLLRVVFPASLPNIMTGIQQAIPLAFIVLISAELIASRQGMGFLISNSGNLGLYDRMFAVIVIFSFVAFFADRLFRRFRRRVLTWA